MVAKIENDDELATEITDYLITLEPKIEKDHKKLEADGVFEKSLDTVIEIEFDETTILEDIQIWETITGFLLRDKRIKNMHQYIDIFDEVSDIDIWTSVFREKDYSKKKELVINFINHFKTLKHFESIIFIHDIKNLPVGFKLGNFEIITSPFSDENISLYFKILQKRSTYKPYFGINYDNGTFCKIKYDNFLYVTTRNKVYSELELPFSILSMYNDYDLDVLHSIGITYTEDGYICDYFPTGSMYRTAQFNGANVQYLKIISNILSKKNYNQLEEKILKSLRLYGLSRLSHRVEIRFLIIVSACENLLLIGDDRDYSTLKISEKTACLLENDGDARYKLYLKMKNIYRNRSKLVHQGYIKINDDELKFIESIYQRLINKLLIENQNYEQIEKEFGDKSAAYNYFFDKLKFNIN